MNLSTQVSDGGGSPYPEAGTYTYFDVNGGWLDVKARAEAIYKRDHALAVEAINAARADDSCNYADDFEGKIKEFEGQFKASISSVDGIVKGNYQTHSQVDVELMKIEDEWQSVKKALGEVMSNVNLHLKADEWISEGAQEYKKSIPTQVKALQELQGIADTQAQAAKATSRLNTMMYSSAVQGFLKILADCPMPPERHVNRDYGRVGGQIEGTWIFDYRFFVASYNVKAYLDTFVTWAGEQADPTSADWATSANDLGSRLEDVQTMPANLQPGGWPEGTSAETPPAAATGKWEYYDTSVSGMGSAESDGSLGLDRRGMG